MLNLVANQEISRLPFQGTHFTRYFDAFGFDAFHNALDTGGTKVAVLAVATFAQLDAGDLGDGVGFVGLLQRAGEEVVLLDRLGAVARVDATGAEETQILDSGLEGAVDDVVLDSEVFVNEVGAVGVVGVNAADSCGSHEDVVGFLGFEEVEYGALIKKVELLPCAG